ncbi:MAG: hypothetical protein J1E43_03590 [Christensenellaceae bacterium]|nr:hypothetical protein [Christensenellaceae bacterium]
MGFLTGIKASKAMNLQTKGQVEEARRLYEEVYAEGFIAARPMLAYALLLIRAGEYKKAQEVLVKTQKAPGLTAEQKSQLFMDYAVCCFKLDDLDRGVRLLERQHAKAPTGLTYGALGYLYVEQYDLSKKQDRLAAILAKAAEPAAEAEADAEPSEEAQPAAPAVDPEKEWNDGLQKVLLFNKEAVDYDEEDPICLDNLAQTYYRCLGDKETAKPLFEKAHQIKPGQIDTLWFLSRYDLEAGNTGAAIEKLETALEGRFSPLNFTNKAMIEAEIERLRK